MNKKLISAAAVFVFGASLAVAAPNDGDGFRGGRHRGAKAEHLARKLNLSDAQLCGRARLLPDFIPQDILRIRRRERGAIDLAVRRQREAIYANEGGRQHVFG